MFLYLTFFIQYREVSITHMKDCGEGVSWKSFTFFPQLMPQGATRSKYNLT